MKVLLINDSTTNSNWGDRAAAISLKAMIRARGGEITHTVSEDDLELSSFKAHFSQIEEGHGSGVREMVKSLIPPILLGVKRRMFKGVDNTPANRLIPEKWEEFDGSVERVLREKKYFWPDLLKGIEEMDVAVIHGDGAMVDNGVIPRTDLFLTYIIKKRYGKPVIMVNHSADFNHPELRRIAERVYPLFDDVVFRDPLSAERCKTLCAGRFAADSAFWFRPASTECWMPVARRPGYFEVWPETTRFDPAEPYVCIGGSSILGYSWKPAEIAEGYAVLIRHLQTLYAGTIVLAVTGLAELNLFRPISRQLGLPLISPTTPVQQVVDILGHADAYVGGRWHTAIFALSGGTPVVALSAKQSKMEALMQSAGLPTKAFDAFSVGEQKEPIGEMLTAHLQGGAEMRRRLRSWADEMAGNTWDNVAYLEQFPAAKKTAEI